MNRVDFLPNKKVYKIIFSDEQGRYLDDQQIGVKEWAIQKDYSLTYLYEDGSKYIIILKKGFSYDGFSTDFGRVALVIQGKHTGAVVISALHDADYSAHFSHSRAFADWAFLVGLDCFGGYCWFLRNIMWGGLRCLGGSVYPKTKRQIQDARKYIEIHREG